MIKRSPSRNARSKGIKAKHVLQICLLLGVCFWLLYQVKHSHDKKKELEEKDASFSQKTLSHEVLPKLGRKDPHPGLQDKTSEKNEEEEEDETGVDEEGNKKEENEHEKDDEEEGGQEGGGTKDEEVEREEQRMHEEEEKGGEVTDHLEKEKEEQIEHEEDEQNEEANINETNDEDRKVGDDEVDERDREKIEGEADPDGEFMDEEKEREDDGEKKESQGNEGEGKEIQGNEDEDREVQTDHETQSDGQDHDGSGKNSHVAREEHYMADDASSAVTHDTQIISTEPEKEGLEKSNEKLVADDLQQDKYSINDNPVDVNGDKNNSTSQLEQAGNGHSLNATADEKKNDVTSPSMSEEGSPNNSTVTPNITTVTVLSSDQSVSSNKSTEVSSEAGDNQVSENLEVPGTSQQNGMLNVSESAQIRNATVDGQVTGDIANLQTTQSEQVNNGINSESIQSDSNSTLLGQTEKADSFGNDSSNSSSNSESGGSDKTIEKPEVTATEDVNSGFSSGTNETKEATHDENSDTIHESGGRDENTDSSTTNETSDAVTHDPNDSSDSSIGQDEKEARIDLDTLPEFGTGRVDNGNVAEE
ncbi:MYB-LIKE PROTEIN X [Salix purpurea]|uniref:MYB-LIKE PROTEIN X n=1 Tax=Salix purpurea TaxID=77065 RepID=A0A9Q0VUE5_SALPP|nr:MYB-LIKE PROTEIN X [Salix purpurea]